MSTYYVWSGATGGATGADWTNAYTSLDNLFTGQAIAGGDIIKIASDHDNTSYAASKTFNFPESSQSNAAHVFLISTNRTSGLPEAGAIEQTGGNYALTLGHRIYAYGVTFKTGSGGNEASAYIRLGTSSGQPYGKSLFENCTFNCNSTSTAATINLYVPSALQAVFEFRGCTFTQANTGAWGYFSGHATARFIECVLSGTAPTNLFDNPPVSAELFISGSDFSASTNLCLGPTRRMFIRAYNSSLPSSTLSAESNVPGSQDIELHSCGAGDHNYYYARKTNEGLVTDDATVYLTSGGSTVTDTNGSAVPYSLKMVADAHSYDCNIVNALYTPWQAVPCFATGSKTFSIKIAHTNAAVLKDNEAWLELEYMGGSAPANTPLTAFETTMPLISGTVFTDYLAAGSDLTDTAEAWTGITSEITHTLSKTVTVDEQGWVRARVGFAKTNTTLYVNADVAVS